jgi:hypothetical protein
MADLRAELHRRLLAEAVLATRKGIVNVADSTSATSKKFAALMAGILSEKHGMPLKPMVKKKGSGGSFESAVRDYVQAGVDALPSTSKSWRVVKLARGAISHYAQYAHLAEIERLSDTYPELQLYLGPDYLISPDIVVLREPLADPAFGENLIDGSEQVASSTFLRSHNAASSPSRSILHASVSCKWTLRSDRAQNARTEALNLIRNRKGRVPAITVVTAEPLPSRLASLADGTGDVDRVYHVALYELREAVMQGVAENPRIADQAVALDRMVNGLRLADISDLPFDLLV